MRAGASVMTAKSAAVQMHPARGAGAVFGNVRSALGPNLLVSDAVLAAVLTGFALVALVRVTNPVSAGALAAVGTMSLAWRRLAPTAVLMISTASLFAEKLLDHPRTVLSITVLIA